MPRQATGQMTPTRRLSEIRRQVAQVSADVRRQLAEANRAGDARKSAYCAGKIAAFSTVIDVLDLELELDTN